MADFKLSLLMTAIMSCFATECGGGGAHFSTVNDSQNANTASETATPAESAPEPQQTPEETKTEEVQMGQIDGSAFFYLMTESTKASIINALKNEH